MLKTFTAPSSITIVDSDNNRITILKTKSSIEVYSQISNNSVNRHLVALQETIKNYLLNLVKAGDRDNYKVRFAKLAKIVNKTKIQKFSTLKTSLIKELA